MTTPDREVIMRAPDCLYRSGTVRFGGLIGDGTPTGHNIALGSGFALGRHSRLNSGITLTARTFPAWSVLSAPHVAETQIRPRRRRETVS
ncbi:hypothetical protein ACF05T_32010 [Streptomyces lateritius]|uniref:Uncharacterized protein n=1 Tax=Streptomyces lateritius TaxID=67313 RepID=A0ABW6YLB1_9ACTN